VNWSATWSAIESAAGEVLKWLVFGRDSIAQSYIASFLFALSTVLFLAWFRPWSHLAKLDARERRERRSRDALEHLYLANVTGRIQDDEPPWQRHWYTELEGVEQQPIRFQPDFVFVYPRITSADSGEDNPIFGKRINLLELLRRRGDRRLVVLGAPGSGKSVLMRQLALLAVGAAKRARFGKRDLPLVVPVGAYQGITKDGKPQPFVQFLERWIRTRFNGYGDVIADHLADYLAHGQLLLLLDGLNEMEISEYTQRFEAVMDFAAQYPQTRIIFTCRTIHWDNFSSIPVVRILPLTQRKMLSFVETYLGPIKSKTLLDELRRPSRRAILRDCRVPYFLTMVVELFRDGYAFPSTRAELFSAFVDVMLKRRERKKGLGSMRHEIDTILSPFAARMNTDKLLGVLVPRIRLERELNTTQHHSSITTAAEAGLLDVTHDDQVGFGHHMLQEYFASLWLKQQIEHGADLREQLEDPSWAETLVIASGMLALPAQLIDRIIGGGDISGWRALLAARCIASADLGARSPSRERLHTLLRTQLANGTLPAQVRSLRALTELDDETAVESARPFLASDATVLQDAALTCLAEMQTPQARQAIVQFFSNQVSWVDVPPFIRRYNLAVSDRGPVIRAVALRSLVEVAYGATLAAAAGLSIFALRGAKVVADEQQFRSADRILPLLLFGFLFIIISIAVTNRVSKAVLTRELWTGALLPTTILGGLFTFVVLQPPRLNSPLYVPLFALYLLLFTQLVLVVLRWSTNLIGLVRCPPRRRTVLQAKFAFSRQSLAVIGAAALLWTGTAALIQSHQYVIQAIGFLTIAPFGELSVKLFVIGAALWVGVLLVLTTLAGMISASIQLTNLRVLWQLRRIERGASATTRTPAERVVRISKLLTRTALDERLHSAVRARAVRLLGQLVAPKVALPTLVRLSLDPTTVDRVRGAAARLIDSIGEHWLSGSRTGSDRLVDALLDVSIAGDDRRAATRDELAAWSANAPDELTRHNARAIVGLMLTRQSRLDDAYRHLSLALAEAPQALSLRLIHVGLGLRLREFDVALAELQEIIEAYGPSENHWTSRLAIRTSPLQVRIWSGLSTLLSKTRHLSWLRDGVQALHEFSLVNYQRWFEEHAMFLRSLAQADESLRLDPACAAYFRNRAGVLLCLSRLDEAEADLRKAGELEPGHPRLGLRLCQLHLMRNRPDDALSAIVDVIQRFPVLDNWYLELSLALLAGGHDAAALRAFRLALSFGLTIGEREELAIYLRTACSEPQQQATVTLVRRIFGISDVSRRGLPQSAAPKRSIGQTLER
jgi:tetratricopeptide (TPR) repeat protein